jgi:hypothetical protein
MNSNTASCKLNEYIYYVIRAYRVLDDVLPTAETVYRGMIWGTNCCNQTALEERGGGKLGGQPEYLPGSVRTVIVVQER